MSIDSQNSLTPDQIREAIRESNADQRETVRKADSQNELDALIRDACSVVPVSKGEYRSRLQALIQSERQAAAIEEWEKFRRIMIIVNGEGVQPSVEQVGIYIHKRITELREEAA